MPYGAAMAELYTRRTFLQLSAASGALLLGARCTPGGEPGGPDAGPDAADLDAGALTDADPALCRVTTADAQGPFFVAGAPMRVKIAEDDEPGERLLLSGHIVGGDCVTPLAGVAIEVWQADREGAYHDAGEGYRLRGRATSDADGRFVVETIRPGNYQLGAGSWRPAHVHFTFTHPDYRSVTTQIYFAGDPYLPPNDGCTTCASDDPDRVLALDGDAGAGWTGELPIVLAAR